jgi:hypothetical protein
MKAEDILEFGACGLEHTLPRLREIFEKSHSIPEGFRLSCFPVLRKLIEEGNLKIAWGFVRCLQYHFDKYNITTPGEGEQYTKMVILYRNDGTVKFAFTNIEGEVKNGIAVEERGTDGFGFDPIIIPNGQKLTYAEMGLEGKNTMSHRKKALELFREFLDSQKNKKDI